METGKDLNTKDEYVKEQERLLRMFHGKRPTEPNILSGIEATNFYYTYCTEAEINSYRDLPKVLYKFALERMKEAQREWDEEEIRLQTQENLRLQNEQLRNTKVKGKIKSFSNPDEIICLIPNLFKIYKSATSNVKAELADARPKSHSLNRATMTMSSQTFRVLKFAADEYLKHVNTETLMERSDRAVIITARQLINDLRDSSKSKPELTRLKTALEEINRKMKDNEIAPFTKNEVDVISTDSGPRLRFLPEK